MTDPQPRRIYLDNAATSWPKPETVYAAVDHYQRNLGAAAGRSTYREAMAVQQAVDQCRRGLAALLEVDDPRRIVFTFNGTDSLNLAIGGLLEPGDHVVTTVCEHNSVLRPLRDAQQRLGAEVTRVGCDPAGVVAAGDVAAAVRADTRLVVMTQASNVTGALQPVAEVGRLLRGQATLLLVDAAQSLGHLRISPSELGADLLAAPGHKGLLGPLGTGVLYVGERAEEQLRSVRQGGTGTNSEDDRQPDSLPEKYESGNLNAPGILGLGAAVQYLASRGWDAIRQHEQQLTATLTEGLAAIGGVRLFGPSSPADRVGVVSIQVEGYDPHEVAAMLDGQGIQARAGVHCAPAMHRALGTLSGPTNPADRSASGEGSRGQGTLRFSLGVYNTQADVQAAIAAVAQIAETAIAPE